MTHQLKYLTLNVFMTNSCFEWNCSTLTLNSIEVKEVNLPHFGAPEFFFQPATPSFFCCFLHPSPLLVCSNFLSKKNRIQSSFPFSVSDERLQTAFFRLFFYKKIASTIKSKPSSAVFSIAKPASSVQRFD